MSHSGAITEGLTFIEAEALAQKIRESTEQRSFSIIDVRESNEFHENGHIIGATNIPSGQFSEENTTDAVLESLLDKSEVFVHCMHSQKRGPTCAKSLTSALERFLAKEENNGKSFPQITVLRGGFGGFQEKFADSDLLVEKKSSA